MNKDTWKLQSQLAALHREMESVSRLIADRNDTIIILHETMSKLLTERDLLRVEIATLHHEHADLEGQLNVMKADRDTLIGAFAPLFHQRDIESDETAAQLVAVLLLSNDDMQHTWRLIHEAASKADQVENLAQRLLSLLDGTPMTQSDEQSIGLLDHITDQELKRDIEAAIDTIRGKNQRQRQRQRRRR